MSIFQSKMPSLLQTSLRNPHHLSTAIYLSLLAMTLIVRTTLAAAVLNSYNLSSFTPPSQDVTLNRFVVHNRTGSIYVAAEKFLFRLGSDLQNLEGTGTSSCAEDDNCDDITKILAISQGDAESLIICTSAEGKCEVRDLSDIEQVVHSSSIMVPGESAELTAAGVITEVAQGGNLVEKFYVANTLSAEATSFTHPIIRWTVSDSFDQADELNHYALNVAVNSFPISYKETFTHNGFVYFVMNQVGNVKLGRVCETARMEYYSEITLRCDSRKRPGTSYTLVQAARVGKAGSALQMSIGSGPDSILYAAFSESDSVSSNAALCMYSMADVEAAFLQAVKDCLSGTQDARLSYLYDATCDELILPDDILLGLMCSQEYSFTYANGIHPLVSSAAVEMSSHVPTSIVSAVVRNHTVVFIGTQEGDLLKVHVMSNTTGRLYETVPLGSTPILPDMYNDQDTSILTANQQSLYRLAVANCGQYSTCGECIGVGGAEDGDPYCGWCTLQATCTQYRECVNPEETDHWLAYDTRECINITRLTPSSLPRQQSEVDITFAVAHLPILESGSYSCRFDDITSEVTSSVGNNVTCPSPASNELPEIQSDGDHIALTLSLAVDPSGIEIISKKYFFYDCSRITSCTACSSSQWDCDWCIHDNACTHNSSSCSAVITGVDGPSSCAKLLPVTSAIQIPVGLEREFQLKAINLPSMVDDFQCVVNIEDQEHVTSADIVNGTDVICAARSYTFTTGVLELDVPVSVRWNGNFYIDSPSNLNVTLYNCEFERDSCSRCLSSAVTPVDLRCGWCGNVCGVRESPECQGDSWIPQGSNRSCPGPVVSKIFPMSGPIEGNTLVEIFGSDLGQKFSDIDSIMLHQQLCNRTGLEESYQVGSRVKCLTSASGEPREAVVKVTVGDPPTESTGSVIFTYRDPEITGFHPSSGIANGGTVVMITGTSLQTGSNITASIGNAVCDIMYINDTYVTCKTSGTRENTSSLVTLRFDGAERNSTEMFTYKTNPTIAGLSTSKSIASGGVNITINGVGFKTVQEALLIATLIADPTKSDSVACHLLSDTEMVCPSPRLPTLHSTPTKRRHRREVEEVSLAVSLDDYLVNISDSFEFYPDPRYDTFQEPNGVKQVSSNDTLRITGTGLNLAVSKSDVRVLIGDKFCEVLSIGAEQLFCRLPPTQPQAGSHANGTSQTYPAVIVLHGSVLHFSLGSVHYIQDSVFSIVLVIVIAVLVGVAVVFTLIAVSFYGRRVHQHKLKSAEGALIRLEERLKDKATEAFHDLQRDMSGLKEQLQGVGMPFVSGADYIRNMLFWGLKVQPMTNDPEESIKQAMSEFSKLLNRKEFLMQYIQGLDEAKNLKQKDRVNIASLLSTILTTEGRFHYLTDVMLTLMAEKIEESDENRLKQLFKSVGSILEKLISNWVALCMYKHLQKQVAYPLYVLYQAIKGQVDKGPVDAITGQAHFSLNFDYLLDEDVEFEDVTLQIVDKEHKVLEQVKVLDVDTITQAKQKILDAVYCKRQTAQQLRSNEVDLVLLNGCMGRLVLKDRDPITETRGHWIKANTIKAYKISNGSSVAIVKKQDGTNPEFSAPLVLDKAELAYTYVPRFLESYSPWSTDKNHTQYVKLNALEAPAVNNVRTSWEYTQIDVDPEEGKQMWHLVKDESNTVNSNSKKKRPHKIDHRPKLIKEVYTSRLLVTKNAVQPFLDEFLEATFSLPEGQSSLPVHIKHLFDFFDTHAEEHSEIKDNVSAAWKTNSLALRYWVTAISHPSFIFDMQQSRTADYCINVLTNMLDHACKKNIPTYNLDASLNRILYRPELPRYIEMVEGYYNAIADLPGVSQSQLEEASQQITKEFSAHFSRLGMLHQLYEYTKEHTDMLDNISAIIEERDD
ncbi:plexin-A4 isoform X2 [Strongylocentrotus purpuratus]|uniref:Sema domain-containing protein n=1 Tax=Strongylocentrotus purpuratus TaxID=7668 RepID=A0A7M7PT26_STRPU|nr:plexin-A4 isoform X2 [Strongylocentrotus purpuratus]